MDTNGTRSAGGRYNPKDEIAALYCSESAQLALAEEARQGASTQPRVVPIDVELERVLDLTDPRVRASYLLREADLCAEDHTLTTRIGRAARECGFEALLVPSVGGRKRHTQPA